LRNQRLKFRDVKQLNCLYDLISQFFDDLKNR